MQYTFGQPLKAVTTVELMKQQMADDQHEINMLRKRVAELIDERNDALQLVNNLKAQLNIQDYWESDSA